MSPLDPILYRGGTQITFEMQCGSRITIEHRGDRVRLRAATFGQAGLTKVDGFAVDPKGDNVIDVRIRSREEAGLPPVGQIPDVESKP